MEPEFVHTATPACALWKPQEGNCLGTLRVGELLVVHAPVDLAAALPASLLDADEMRRMTRYRFAADRRRHHAAHALKRMVLGYMLGVPAHHRLRFDAEAGGKPFLRHYPLHFNLSHSGGWIALALRIDAAVGVDVEQVRSTASALPMPPLRHPADPPRLDFLQAWTLKEAVSKCSGAGLALDFTRLRLRPRAKGYACDDGLRDWHAWHGRLDADTHLAVASDRRWVRLRVIALRA
jgi:4'-phosphopantetheinyl transferase